MFTQVIIIHSRSLSLCVTKYVNKASKESKPKRGIAEWVHQGQKMHFKSFWRRYMYSQDLANRIFNKRLNAHSQLTGVYVNDLKSLLFYWLSSKCFFRWINCYVLCNKNCYQVLFRANRHPVPLSVPSKLSTVSKCQRCSLSHFSSVEDRFVLSLKMKINISLLSLVHWR